MRITDWEMKEQEDTMEVSAGIDGFRLWYRLPKAYQVSRAGDPFLAAALLPAMLQGEKLEIDSSLPVSPKLLENVFTLQEIHHCWNPVLKIVPISATRLPAEPLNAGAFTFFSGGVDSTYTFLKHQKEITHAVFINGFDFYLDSVTYQTAVARNSSFARGFGKVLIPVETNYYPFGYHYNLSRLLTQGSALASVALLLGFPRAYVPSSDTYGTLMPWGSHPLTDPLYSSECVKIIHDGAEARRVDKVIKIAEYEPALANLRVCIEDMNVNCGKCTKCIRTMTSLHIIQARTTAFPPFPSIKTIRRMNWKNETRNKLKENMDLAGEKQYWEIHKTLLGFVQRRERIQLLKDIDRVLLSGLIKRAYRRIVNGPPMVRRIDTTPPLD